LGANNTIDGEVTEPGHPGHVVLITDFDLDNTTNSFGRAYRSRSRARLVGVIAGPAVAINSIGEAFLVGAASSIRNPFNPEREPPGLCEYGSQAFYAVLRDEGNVDFLLSLNSGIVFVAEPQTSLTLVGASVFANTQVSELA
jgi:hypothetical protein